MLQPGSLGAQAQLCLSLGDSSCGWFPAWPPPASTDPATERAEGATCPPAAEGEEDGSHGGQKGPLRPAPATGVQGGTWTSPGKRRSHISVQLWGPHGKPRLCGRRWGWHMTLRKAVASRGHVAQAHRIPRYRDLPASKGTSHAVGAMAAAHEGEVRGRRLHKQQPGLRSKPSPGLPFLAACTRAGAVCACTRLGTHHGHASQHTPRRACRGTSTGLPHVQDKNMKGRGWHTAAQATAFRLCLRSSRAS